MEIKSDYGIYYNNQLKIGQEYQDFITKDLMNYGLCYVSFNSKKYQQNVGENSAGIEIKCDMRFQDTGNLYIEISEKSNPTNINFINSGIYRDDNSFLYIIGDYKKYWIFSKKKLIELHKSGVYEEKMISTSRGYLLPIKEANQHCIKHHIPKENYASHLP